LKLEEAKKYIENATNIRTPIEAKYNLLCELEAVIPTEKAK